MQSVFCQLHNRVQSACGLHHNYSENTELHRVSQINTSRGEGSTESVSSIWSGLYLAVSALLARNDFLVSCKECRSPLRFFLRFCLVLFSAMHWAFPSSLAARVELFNELNNSSVRSSTFNNTSQAVDY